MIVTTKLMSMVIY